MTDHKGQSAGAGDKPGGGKAAGREPGARGEEPCRCKEVARKTPGELLRLMISDLAFWRKSKR